MYFQGTIGSLVQRPMLFVLMIFALGSQLIYSENSQAAGAAAIQAEEVAKKKL